MAATRHQKDGGVNVIIAEAQLILAEKRTSLAGLRTGIAVCALPLSVLSLLVATSQYYEVMQVLTLLLPLIALCAALLGLSGYLMIHAVIKLRRQDGLLNLLKRNHSQVAEFLD